MVMLLQFNLPGEITWLECKKEQHRCEFIHHELIEHVSFLLTSLFGGPDPTYF